MNKSPIILPDFGKIPPQSIDMEEAVLGAILNDKEAIFEIINILKPESFYKDAHRRIYKSIIGLNSRNFPIDIFTVTEELRAFNELDQVGGPVYLSKLTSKIISSVNIEYHARIVQQKYIQRELIRIGTELQSRSFDDTFDVAELFEYAETELLIISGQVQDKEPVKLSFIVDSVIGQIEKVINHEIKLIGIPSGFTKYDRGTGGFLSGELTIIAGRPSMGKTALALQLAKNTAEQKNPVVIFSCEMARESLGLRYISGETGKTNVELRAGDCSIDTLLTKTEGLLKLPIYIDDTSAISLIELRAKTRKLIMKHGIKIIFVDYLQLMKGEGRTRENEVSNISAGLKSIAKDFDIPVIALSQLNRNLERTGDKRPQLSDLRESGALEQDADVVVFIHRPAKYGLKNVLIDDREYSSEGIMEAIIAKNRNGIVGSIFMTHNVPMTSITDFDEYKFNEVTESSQVGEAARPF